MAQDFNTIMTQAIANDWPILEIQSRAMMTISKFVKNIGNKKNINLILKTLNNQLLIFIEDSLDKKKPPIFNFMVIKYNTFERWHLIAKGAPIDVIISTLNWNTMIATLAPCINMPDTIINYIIDGANTIHIQVTDKFYAKALLYQKLEYITAYELNVQTNIDACLNCTEENIYNMLMCENINNQFVYITTLLTKELIIPWINIIKTNIQNNTHEMIEMIWTPDHTYIKTHQTPKSNFSTIAFAQVPHHCKADIIQAQIKPLPFVLFFRGIDGLLSSNDGTLTFAVDSINEMLVVCVTCPPIVDNDNAEKSGRKSHNQFPGGSGYLTLPLFNMQIK